MSGIEARATTSYRLASYEAIRGTDDSKANLVYLIIALMTSQFLGVSA
jgi:hypothetical protein